MREKYIKEVEKPRDVAMTMASGSNTNNSNRNIEYPGGVIKYEHLVADRELFMKTLEQVHSVMSTKLTIPVIGGRELDLHQLFVEVTSRGGVEKIIKEKRWKEVAYTFNFPSTTTNASFLLRKYYCALLQAYEHIYYFNNMAAILQGSKTPPAPAPAPGQPPSAEKTEQQEFNTVPGVGEASAVGKPVTGVIDGTFDGGYLISVKIGTEILKGVMYQPKSAQNVCQVQQPFNVPTAGPDSPPGIPRLAQNVRQVQQPFNVPTAGPNSPPGIPRLAQNVRQVEQPFNVPTAGPNNPPGIPRKKPRMKSELGKSDPSDPKPDISGYNFFLADQHARVIPLHPGKDREITPMLELWNNLMDNEKAEEAVQGKERCRTEMEDYRGGLGTNLVISDAVPKQQFTSSNANLIDMDVKKGTYPEMASESSKSETEDDNESFSETGTSFAVGVESGANAGPSENSAAAGGSGAFQVVQEDETMPNSPSEAEH